jgi:hypothetical protein
MSADMQQRVAYKFLMCYHRLQFGSNRLSDLQHKAEKSETGDRRRAEEWSGIKCLAY